MDNQELEDQKKPGFFKRIFLTNPHENSHTKSMIEPSSESGFEGSLFDSKPKDQLIGIHGKTLAASISLLLIAIIFSTIKFYQVANTGRDDLKRSIHFSYQTTQLKNDFEKIRMDADFYLSSGRSGALKTKLRSALIRTEEIMKESPDSNLTMGWIKSLSRVEKSLNNIGIDNQGSTDLNDQIKIFKENLYMVSSKVKENNWRTLTSISKKMIEVVEGKNVTYLKAMTLQKKLKAFERVYEKSRLSEANKQFLRFLTLPLKNSLEPILSMTQESMMRAKTLGPNLASFIKTLDESAKRSKRYEGKYLDTIWSGFQESLQLSLSLILLSCFIAWFAFRRAKSIYWENYEKLKNKFQSFIDSGHSSFMEDEEEIEPSPGMFQLLNDDCENAITHFIEERKQDDLILRGLPFPTALIDRSGRLLFMSENWNEIPGGSEDEIVQKVTSIPSHEQSSIRLILGKEKNAKTVELWVTGLGGKTGEKARWWVVQVRDLRAEADLISTQFDSNLKHSKTQIKKIMNGQYQSDYSGSHSPYQTINELQESLDFIGSYINQDKQILKEDIQSILDKVNLKETIGIHDLDFDNSLADVLNGFEIKMTEFENHLKLVNESREKIERRNASSLKSVAKMAQHTNSLGITLERYRAGILDGCKIIENSQARRFDYNKSREIIENSFFEVRNLAVKIAHLAGQDKLKSSDAALISEQVREIMDLFHNSYQTLTSGFSEIENKEGALKNILEKIISGENQNQDELIQEVKESGFTVAELKEELVHLNQRNKSDLDAHLEIREQVSRMNQVLKVVSNNLNSLDEQQRNNNQDHQIRIKMNYQIRDSLKRVISAFEQNVWYHQAEVGSTSKAKPISKEREYEA